MTATRQGAVGNRLRLTGRLEGSDKSVGVDKAQRQ
jgi:hypothetical protein